MLRFLQQNGVVLGPCASELLASQAWSSWKDRAEVFRGADLREAGGGGGGGLGDGVNPELRSSDTPNPKSFKTKRAKGEQ